MTVRGAAIILGLAAGIAALFLVRLDWALAVALLPPNIAAAVLGNPEARLAWAIAGGTSGFAAVAMLAALIGGMAETAKVRRRIGRLRYDPALAERWNAADWRAAFARTAIADHAEAMIALTPLDKDEPRRVFVDASLLLDLTRIWLDRLTLIGAIAPLPAILVVLAATLALVAVEAGDSWALVLAAGTTGWFAIRLFQYLARAALTPLANAAVAGATAAIRPLNVAHGIDLSYTPVPPPVPALPAPKRIEQDEAEIIAAALSNAIWEPLRRLADAADRLASAAPPSRDQSIQSALAEVRAGIEKLLAGSGHGD